MRLRLPPKLTSALVLAALLAGPAPARAVSLLFSIDPAQSHVSQGGASYALSGLVFLELGQLPPVAANTPMDVVGLVASFGSLLDGTFTPIGLDDGLANPGLGVLFPDGSFLIPSLHLEVDGASLTVSEVTGTLGPSAPCSYSLCFELETAFDLEPPSGGPIHVSVVAGAAVPEPGPALLASLALSAGALASTRLRRGSL
jgi:hypothetical protein